MVCVCEREGPQESVSEVCVSSMCVCQVGKKEKCQCVGVSGCVIGAVWMAQVGEKAKKFQRRESNPGLKRERLECYRLHHIGFYLYVSISLAIKKVRMGRGLWRNHVCVSVCVCFYKEKMHAGEKKLFFLKEEGTGERNLGLYLQKRSG